MRILTKIKQLFCKHSFEKHYIPYGFRIVDGWCVHTFEYKCLKCGKWERSEKSFSYYQYKCNNCGCDDYTQTDRQGECKLMNYCPNCGAKMDNEQER